MFDQINKLFNKLFSNEESLIFSLLILTFLVFEFISDPGSLNPICPFLPIPNTCAHAKNQLSRSNGKGARPCTDRHADVSKNRKRGITQ